MKKLKQHSLKPDSKLGKLLLTLAVIAYVIEFVNVLKKETKGGENLL